MKYIKRLTSVFLLLILLLEIAPVNSGRTAHAVVEDYSLSELKEVAEGIVSWKKTQLNLLNEDYLISGSLLEQSGSSVGDWYPLALGRLGYEDNYSSYLAVIKDYVEEKYAGGNGLHDQKATEWHRIALAVLSLSGDPTALGKDAKGQEINLIADGTYNRGLTEELGQQGINGWIWGLITLDSLAYKIPEGSYYSRNEIITEIIKRQHEDGGFSLGDSTGDPDITAMAVQALAPYYNSQEKYTYDLLDTGQQVNRCIREVVDAALECLSTLQGEAGDYSAYGAYNAESTAQAIIALCSLGIDPYKDSRFIKNGHSLIDGLLKYRNDDGGFVHSYEEQEDNTAAVVGKSNSMAGEQVLCAIAAVIRYKEGFRRLYDFREEMTEELKKRIAHLQETIDGLTENTPKDQVYKAHSLYVDIPAYERSYVYNFYKLADLMKSLGIENKTEYLSEALAVNSSGSGFVVNIFTSEAVNYSGGFDDRAQKLYNSLPETMTTKYHTEVTTLIAVIEASENSSDYQAILEDLKNKKAEIEAIQQEIEAINALVLEKIYPLEDVSLKDKKALVDIIARINKLSSYDREQILRYEDIVRAQARLQSLERALIIAALLVVISGTTLAIVMLRIRKRRKEKLQRSDFYDTEESSLEED